MKTLNSHAYEYSRFQATEPSMRYNGIEAFEAWQKRDGYYAFVCEKCASVFGYYGHFAYEKELYERSRRIYEGS